MMRLIDADALQEKCKEIAACEWNQKTGPYSWSYALECFLDDVDLMPTVDAVPVVHGRWIKDGNFLVCLNCESEINVKTSLGVENHKNYCPNCGAKMDLEEKE